MARPSILRIALSAVIVFQLIGVIFLPNLSSYTGRKLATIYLPYMSGLGLGGAWSFFAPEPFSPPMFIDYTLDMADSTPVSGRYPDVNEHFFWREHMNRRVALTRFVLTDDKYVEFMFMNYICRKYPSAKSARVWSVRGLQPDYNMVREQGKKMSLTIEYKSDFIGDYACKRDSQ